MTDNVNDLMRKLAEDVILSDCGNLTKLADMGEHFQALAVLIDGSEFADHAPQARMAAQWLERIILRDCDDEAVALSTVVQITTAMQQIICDGEPADRVTFPHDGSSAAIPAQAPDAEATHASSGQPNDPAPPASNESASADDSDSDSAYGAEDEPLTGDSDLMVEFIQESREHLDAADVNLLTIETNPTEAEAINAVFRAFHTIKGVAGFLDLRAVQTLAHESETLLDQCRKGQREASGDALDIIFEAVDQMKQLIAAVESALSDGSNIAGSASLGPLLKRIKTVTQAESPESPAVAPNASPLPAVSTADGSANAPAILSAEDEAKEAAEFMLAAAPVEAEASDQAQPAPPVDVESSAPAPATSPTQKTKAASENIDAPSTTERKTAAQPDKQSVRETVRVDAERLDKLIDIIGEMVIAEAMVNQSLSEEIGASSDSARLISHLTKITRELQELAMSLRMVPVRATFQRMAILARDVSKKLGKPVEFVTAGEETELDKNVVDAIGDPLVHMVRNAIDHGLESSTEDRQAANKPEAGRVELRAFHQGGSIFIEIEDDGKGLDRDVIIAKARDRGLIGERDNLTDTEVFGLIFEPGFSTAKAVTDLSGRGVGLDVVKRNIQAMRGKVEVRSSIGGGTIFSIRLPLTLAIIEGMVVRIGNDRYVLPTLSIVRMVRPDEMDMTSVFERGRMLKLGDQLIPLYWLDQIFNVADTTRNANSAAIVIIEHESRQIAFMVDELLGQQQIVIKPLGKVLQNCVGFSGGAIMPDGRVGLILDVAGLTGIADQGDGLRTAA